MNIENLPTTQLIYEMECKPTSENKPDGRAAVYRCLSNRQWGSG